MNRSLWHQSNPQNEKKTNRYVEAGTNLYIAYK